MNKHITVELSGGLANQLFQWAAGQTLAFEYGADLLIDGRIPARSWERGIQIDQMLTDITVIRPDFKTVYFWEIINKMGYFPRALAKRVSLALPRSGVLATNYYEAHSALKSGMTVRLRGLFQDADRLHSKRDQVIGGVREGLARLSSKNDTILPHKFSAIHVRRGDYILVKKYLSEFGVCSVNYYRKAIERLNPELPILVVTDDHDWVRSKLMKIDDRIQLYEGKNHFDDLFTLSLAHELVMANSTFSWWAAYLSSAELVISPNPWFTNNKREQDLVHPSWIKLPRD